MLRWFKILFIALCFAFSCQASASAHSCGSPASEKHGMVYDHQQKPQAVLSEALDLARICGSMPERVLPSSNFTPSLRASVRSQSLFNAQIISFTNYRGLGCNVSKPILAVPLCVHYYVFTLRHLLC